AFRPRLLVRRHRHPDAAGESIGDLREVRDQNHLLEDLPHPQELLHEELPGDLRVQGAEVPFVDEERLHPAERATDLRHRGELPRDREPQGRVDLRLLAAAELGHIMPLSVNALHEDPDAVAPTFLVRLEPDPAESAVHELGQILQDLDFEFRQKLIHNVHNHTSLIEHTIDKNIVNLEFSTKHLTLSLQFLQFLRIYFQKHDLFFQNLHLSLEQMPNLPFRIEFSLKDL